MICMSVESTVTPDNSFSSSHALAKDAGPRFPQEVCDIIIDHLHGEQTALRQCSLVCTSWMASSSLHLFERLSWPPARLHTRAWPRPRVKTCVSLPFAALLGSLQSSTRLTVSVRFLLLSSYQSDIMFHEEGEPLSFAVLQAIIMLLPRLRKLDVSDVGWSLDITAVDIGPRFSTINMLILDTAKAADTRVASLLRLFQHIKRLVIVTLPFSTFFRSRSVTIP